MTRRPTPDPHLDVARLSLSRSRAPAFPGAVRGRPRLGGLLLGVAAAACLALLPDLTAGPAGNLAAPAAPAAPAQGTDEPAASVCRVVATPLSVEPLGGDTWAWSDVQNVGADAVHGSSLDLGWSGGRALVEVAVEIDGGARVSLFSGSVSSPASIELAYGAGAPALPPGGRARLGLRFDGGTADPVPVPGPSVLHLEEGCSVALHAPPSDDCQLAVTSPRPSADPRRIVVELSNHGTTPALAAALDVEWPVDENGGLRAIWVDGRAHATFEPAIASAPAVLDLQSSKGGSIEVAAGSSVEVWLDFEKTAAEGPYVVAAAGTDGCVTAGTTWLRSPICGVVGGDPTARGSHLQLRLTNRLPVERVVRTLDLFWPAATNGPLVAVRWNGREVWRGEEKLSPVSIAPGARIGAHETATVDFEFAPGSATGEGEAGAAGISGAGHTLVVGLGGGCQLVFGTRRPSAGTCGVAAGEVMPAGDSEVQAVLTNGGSDAAIRRIALSWPVRNGALTGVWLDGTVLYAGRQEPGTEPFVIDTGAAPPSIARGATVKLRLRFALRAARLGYAISLSLADARGVPCAEIVITPPEVVPDCRLSIEWLSKESERDVEVFVANDGRDEVELRYVNLSWPTNDNRNRLTSIHLVDDDAEYLLWSGDQRRSPSRLPLSQLRAGLVDPGAKARLRLHFDPLVMDGDPADAFQVTVGAAAGCEASWPDAGRPVRAERRAFAAIVMALPQGGVWGTWTVGRQRGATRETLAIEVSDATRLEPPAVIPSVGDLVEVEAVVYEDAWRAERVVFLSPKEVVEVVGTVTEIDPSAGPAGRPSWIRISTLAQPVRIVADTHLDGLIEKRGRVRVQGTLDSRGVVTATSIVGQSAPAAQAVTVRGTVQSARQTGPGRTDLQEWVVDHYRVQVDLSRPEQRWPDPPFDRLPQRGARVEVRGLLTGNVVSAISVRHLAPAATRRLSGVLVSLPADGLLGTWRVRTAGAGEVDVLVESVAVVDTSAAPAAAAMHVEVVAQVMPDGRLSALSVRTDWP